MLIKHFLFPTCYCPDKPPNFCFLFVGNCAHPENLLPIPNPISVSFRGFPLNQYYNNKFVFNLSKECLGNVPERRDEFTNFHQKNYIYSVGYNREVRVHSQKVWWITRISRELRGRCTRTSRSSGAHKFPRTKLLQLLSPKGWQLMRNAEFRLKDFELQWLRVSSTTDEHILIRR